MLLIYELYIPQICFIEDNSHDSLACTNWTVDFSVHFIDTYWISLSHKSIKYILAKLFTLDNNFFAYRMKFFIKCRQSVYSVCLFSYSWCDWTRVQSIKASSSNNWNLRSPWDKDLYFSCFKSLQDLTFQEGRLRKASNHENKINLFFFCLNLRNKLLDFTLNILKQRLEKRCHQRSGNLNIRCTFYLNL